jgi:hypothetical protein
MPMEQPPRAASKASATAAAAPDLSPIAEQLRPLAVPCCKLLLDPANARRHPEPNLEALKGSLRVYGQRKPVVVNRRTGTSRRATAPCRRPWRWAGRSWPWFTSTMTP